MFYFDWIRKQLPLLLTIVIIGYFLYSNYLQKNENKTMEEMQQSEELNPNIR